MKPRTMIRAAERLRKMQQNRDALLLRRMGIYSDKGNPKKLRPNPANRQNS